MNILEEIVLNTRKEVAERKKVTSVKELEGSEFFSRETYKVKPYFEDRSGIIAEFKRQSPSKGIINATTDVEGVTSGYANAGASMLSVLADKKYFGGSMEFVKRARIANEIPILRKDFIVDEYQVLEAKAIGADAILLIAGCLSHQEMERLGEFAHSFGLSVLMEIHNEAELNKCLNPFIDLLGVNNRNLKTFDVSIQTSIDLVEKIPDEFIKVSESGLKDADTIKELKSHGYSGFLIGETFMKTNNPPATLMKLVEELKK